MEYIFKKRELDNSSKLNQTRASLPEKNTTNKKELLYLWVTLQKGVMVSVKTMMSENQTIQSEVHVTAFRDTEG
jgi:hypothetical protein